MLTVAYGRESRQRTLSLQSERAFGTTELLELLTTVGGEMMDNA